MLEANVRKLEEALSTMMNGALVRPLSSYERVPVSLDKLCGGDVGVGKVGEDRVVTSSCFEVSTVTLTDPASGSYRTKDCLFHQRGTCKFGDTCPYRHEITDVVWDDTMPGIVEDLAHILAMRTTSCWVFCRVQRGVL